MHLKSTSYKASGLRDDKGVIKVHRRINVTVSRKVARADSRHQYVCGNNDFIVDFDFDAEWDEYPAKTARFISNGEYVDVVFNRNECKMPMFSDTHSIYVGVFAGDLRTTTPALIVAAKSILCGMETPAEPTPDVYTQLMEIMNESVRKTNASEDAAKESEINAAESAKTAVEMNASSLEAMNAAVESAQSAAQNATSAAQSEQNAAQSANLAEQAASAAGWMQMEIDEQGHLIYTRTATVDAIDFEMQEGRLMVSYG